MTPRETRETKQKMANEDACKLFVAGLPEAMSEEGLRELFTSSGSKIEDLSMPRDRMTGRPRGFAFVRLASPADADAARATLDGTFVEGRSISVRPFSAEPPARGERGPGIPLRSVTGASMQREPGGGFGDRPGPRGPGGPGGPGGPDSSDRTLYVGNLPYDASEGDVKELFEQLGIPPAQRIHLPSDPDGRKRGFGFVTVASAEEAVSSLEKLKEAQVRGRRLVVNIAHPKGDRPPPRAGGFDRGPGGFDRGPGGFDRGPGGFDRGPGGFDRGPAGGGYGGAGAPPGGAPGGSPEERRRRTFSADDRPGGSSAAFGKAGNKKRRPLEPKNAGKKRGGGGSGGGWEEDDY